MRTLIRNLTYVAILTLVLSVVSAGTARASATTTMSNVSINFDGFTVFVPCAAGGAGEWVVFNGDLHVLLEETDNAAGGIQVKSHFQPQGLTGTGLTTGAKYQATGVTQDEFNVGPGGLPYTETFVNNFRMIGQGPGNNYMVHETFHITINANGTVTAYVDNFSITCN
jgi:hypothetical protein